MLTIPGDLFFFFLVFLKSKDIFLLLIFHPLKE